MTWQAMWLRGGSRIYSCGSVWVFNWIVQLFSGRMHNRFSLYIHDGDLVQGCRSPEVRIRTTDEDVLLKVVSSVRRLRKFTILNGQSEVCVALREMLHLDDGSVSTEVVFYDMNRV